MSFAVAGLSVASLLAAGAYAVATRSNASGSNGASASLPLLQQPDAAKVPLRAFVVPDAAFEPKSDRPSRTGRVSALPREAAGLRAAPTAEPAPLSGAAFSRRFPAVSLNESKTPGLAGRFVVGRLLARPKAGEVRAAFAPEALAPARNAAVFHPLQVAALAPARTATALVPVAPPAPAPVILASLPGPAAEALEDLSALPDRTEAPVWRPTPATPRAAPQALAPTPTAPTSAPAQPDTAALPGVPRAVSPRLDGLVPNKPAATLAYARPDDPIDDATPAPKIPWPGSPKRVAFYDISAGVVHMPGGENLEAHSGRGTMRDNPAFAHVKMRGPTPPSTYKLTMREAPFHGVEAIRLTPVDGVAPHGRVGLLAHTYLLRNAPPGDSSGCIVFKDYKRFLNAFKRGEVDQIVVVPRMNGATTLAAKVASTFSAMSSPRSR